MTAQALTFGHVDEDTPNQRVNHLATADDLSGYDTCCLCRVALTQDERYLCRECSESSVAIGAAQIARQRAKQSADGTGWRPREPFDPFAKH